MHIYLIRHTDYDNPNNLYAFRSPFELSERGKEHAARIGEWLNQKQLRETPIYSSPIYRCQQTAQIIAEKTHSTISYDERLIETYCPTLQGKPQSQKDPWKIETDHPDREPIHLIEERVLSIFEEKVRLEEDCIFVSHGDPLTLLYYHLIKQPAPKYMWDPQNSDQVISKGEIVDVEVKESGEYVVHRYII